MVLPVAIRLAQVKPEASPRQKRITTKHNVDRHHLLLIPLDLDIAVCILTGSGARSSAPDTIVRRAPDGEHEADTCILRDFWDSKVDIDACWFYIYLFG